jgi:HEAT repeat protein
MGSPRGEGTKNARRDVLAAALESKDAGLRYAAASALAELSDEQAIKLLRRRLGQEKNPSVRGLIEADLRA